MTRGLVRLAAAAALGLLGACSATQFAYNNADAWLRWQGDRYLDLDGAQGEALAARIDAFMAWHRREALPQYARLAGEAGRRFGDGLTREDLDWGYDALRVQAREGLRTAAAEVAGLLDRLAPEQIAHLETRLEDDNRKFAKEHLQGTPAERRARRLRRNLERLEEWLGTLNDAQLERVRQYAERAPLADELRDSHRRRRQAELVAMLRAREAGRRLADWAANWERGRAPAYESALRAQREALFGMLLELDRSLSAAQRRRALERARSLESDFRMLARQQAPAWSALQ